jgi:hypothetical protein
MSVQEGAPVVVEKKPLPHYWLKKSSQNLTSKYFPAVVPEEVSQQVLTGFK